LRFLSLNTKLTIIAATVLTIVLSVAGYFTINLSVQRAYSKIEESLNDTLLGAARNTDGDALEELGLLVPSYDPNTDYDSTSYQAKIAPAMSTTLYQDQIRWLDTIHEINPHAYPYLFVKGPLPHQVIFVADEWALDPANRERATEFGEYYIADYRGELLDLAFQQPTLFTIIDPSEIPAYNYSGDVIAYLRDYNFAQMGNLYTYQDVWGEWVSGYAPVRNSQGQIVGAIGIDYEADYVRATQRAIARELLITFTITYLILLVAVALVTRTVTTPLKRLTHAMSIAATGSYDQDVSALTRMRIKDEISVMADVFQQLLSYAVEREQELLEQIPNYPIIVDRIKTDEQVAKMFTEPFLRRLHEKLPDIRKRAALRREKNHSD